MIFTIENENVQIYMVKEKNLTRFEMRKIIPKLDEHSKPYDDFEEPVIFTLNNSKLKEFITTLTDFAYE